MDQHITDLARRAETALTVEQAGRHIAQAQVEQRAVAALTTLFERVLGMPLAFDRTTVRFDGRRDHIAHGYLTTGGCPLVFALLDASTLFVSHLCPTGHPVGAKGHYGAFVLRTLADFGRFLLTEPQWCQACNDRAWREHVARGGD